MSSAQELGPSGDALAIDKATLVDYLAAGCKPQSEWLIGTEHEKFAYRQEDYRPVAYGGDNGIRAILEGLMRFGWRPVFEDGELIALSDDAGGSVSSNLPVRWNYPAHRSPTSIKRAERSTATCGRSRRSARSSAWDSLASGISRSGRGRRCRGCRRRAIASCATTCRRRDTSVST